VFTRIMIIGESQHTGTCELASFGGH